MLGLREEFRELRLAVLLEHADNLREVKPVSVPVPVEERELGRAWSARLRLDGLCLLWRPVLWRPALLLGIFNFKHQLLFSFFFLVRGENKESQEAENKILLLLLSTISSIIVGRR